MPYLIPCGLTLVPALVLRRIEGHISNFRRLCLSDDFVYSLFQPAPLLAYASNATMLTSGTILSSFNQPKPNSDMQIFSIRCPFRRTHSIPVTGAICDIL